MPQLDFANPLTVAQVVWMALIFLGLYLMLAKWALPEVAAVVDARAETIAGNLNTARAAKAEADAAVAEITEATRRANAEAQAEIAKAVAAAKAEAAEQSRQADARLDAQLAEAEQRIAAARAAAMGALREVATDAANTVVSRLTGRPADAVAVRNAVDGALAARA